MGEGNRIVFSLFQAFLRKNGREIYESLLMINQNFIIFKELQNNCLKNRPQKRSKIAKRVSLFPVKSLK